jgi:hypothetical protein
MSEKSNGLLTVLNTARVLGAAVGNSNSTLIAQLKSSTVTPLVMVERSLAHSKTTEDLMHVILSQYSAMYLAVASRYLNMGVSGAYITKTLNKLATERDIIDALGVESYRPAKPDMLTLGFEADASAARGGVSAGKANEKYISAINDMNNLALGKLLTLTFTGESGPVEAIVNVRLNVKSVSSELLKDIFEANYADLNPFHRIKLAWLGEMTMFEALTASNDVKRQNRIRLNDVDGTVRSNFVESAKNAGYIIASNGNVPVNNCSGVNIITTQTRTLIEKHIKGDFDNFRDRQRFFDNTATYLIAVVDEEEECTTLYYRDLKDFTTVSNSWIARKGDKQSDLEPMVKDLLQGSVPGLR